MATACDSRDTFRGGAKYGCNPSEAQERHRRRITGPAQMEDIVDPQGRFRALVVTIMTLGCALSVISATVLAATGQG